MIRHGRIASVDLSAGRIVVESGDVETGPIRFLTGGAGGTRVWSRPKVGEQVTLLCPDGDIEGAVALRGHTCDAFPHIGDETREVVEFEDGSLIAYDPASHALDIALAGAATASIVAPGGVSIQGDVTVTGTITASGNITTPANVLAGAIGLKTHKHGGVEPGSGQTGLPT